MSLASARSEVEWRPEIVQEYGALIAHRERDLARTITNRDEQIARDRAKGVAGWDSSASMTYVAWYGRLIDRHLSELLRLERIAAEARAACVRAAQRLAQAALEAECGPCRLCGDSGVMNVCARASGCSHVNDSEVACSCQFREDAA